jgi:zinc protease
MVQASTLDLRKPRTWFIAFLLAFAGCEGKIDNPLGINLKIREEKLSNGLLLLMVEDHTVPIVSYQTWFRVGSVDESPGSTGIAHLFEHLMFKGTPKYGAKQFFLQLEAKGAEVNAYTTRDYTVYYENFVPDLIEKVVDMESDRMANLAISEEMLASERLVVLEERRLRTDNSPEGRMQEALWGLSYKRHHYQWPVIGYPQDLISINSAKLTDFFKHHYSPANAAIVIVGDIKPDETYALVKKYYGSIKAQPRPSRRVPAEPEQREERRLTLRDRVASERVALAYHVTSAEQDDSYALDVLANILFEGSSSRAHRRLVEELDIAMGVSGSAYTPTYPGLFIMTITMKAGVPGAKAEAALDDVIRKAQDGLVTDEEIKRAVRQLTVQLVDGVRTPYGLGQLIGTVQTIFGDPRRFANDLNKYFKITAADVQRVAQKYLIPNNRSIVTLVPGVQVGAKSEEEAQ